MTFALAFLLIASLGQPATPRETGKSEAAGVAVLEDLRQTQEGLTLLADGRELLVTAATEQVPTEGTGREALNGLDALEPGVFVRYRGKWTPRGIVELSELAAWANPLRDKKLQLYQRYDPEMLLPEKQGPAPAVVKLGPNRYRVLDDRELQLYVDGLGTRLLPALWRDSGMTKRYGYRFWFILVRHPAPQASSFPSGVVVIHSGLFRVVENEAQFGFAIAHEIAHIIQEHTWREYLYHREKLPSLRWSLPGIGLIVDSAIRRGYQRDLEAQADRLGLWYMAQAGYDPREGERFLRRVVGNQPGLPALPWDTHNSYGQRRRALVEELAHYSARGLSYSSLKRNSPEFSRFQEGSLIIRLKAARKAATPHR